MNKIIKKFWGVALVVMLLSTILMLPAAPAAAAPYAFSNALALPVMSPGLGIVNVAQSGDVVYALGLVPGAPAVNSFYKSADAGATWSALGLGIGLPAGGNWKLVATAPDDPTYVAVVDATAVPNAVYLSNNGGITFSPLTALAAGTVINSIDISPVDAVTAAHFVAIGGAAAGAGVLLTWQTGLLAPAWAPPPALPGPFALPGAATNVMAVKYSPNFGIDQALLFVTIEPGAGLVNASMQLHLFSYGYNSIDPLGFTFPRAIANGTAVASITSLNTVIVLDDSFVLASVETGFIGAEIKDIGVTQMGGTFRIDTGIPALTRLQGSAAGGATAVAINSLAWDGTNLMTAPYQVAPGAITIYRSANALSALAAFLGSTPYKTPGTGTLPIVFFAGGNAFCVSQGRSACVAKSTDLGKSFDGVALFNNNLNAVSDFWIKSDASVIYAVTDEGAGNDVILWKKTGTTWARVFILAGGGAAPSAWIVRSAQSDTTAVYLGKVGTKTMYKSLDGGEFVWTPRSCTQFIADYAVQSATVVYVAGATGVVKTANGATSWTFVGALTAGACYSINLIADNNFVVGGAAGYVGYYDGTAWTAITVTVGTAPFAAGTVVTASGLASGGVIMAANDKAIGTWTIGTSTALIGWAVDATKAGQGIAYVNSILYVSSLAAGPVETVYRYIYPTTVGVAAGPSDIIAGGAINVAAGAATVNTLQAVGAATSNTLWVRVVAAPNALYSYTESIIGAGAEPVPTSPINIAIPINAINGGINGYTFQWTSLLGAKFDIQLWQDKAMNITAGGPLLAVGTAGATPGTYSVGGIAGLNPGQTYYWRIRIASGFPLQSFWTPLQTFTVQSASYVISLSSPVNGSPVATLQPGFSWTPIPGATSYQFQISKEPSFVVLVYSDNTTTAGESMPVALKLVDGTQYFWRVRVAAPTVGDWSTVGNFSIAVPVIASPTPTITPTITILPTPTITVTLPQPTVIIPTSTAVVEKISPAYIWAIIIIGAVLVIAVIVLIVRTRRTV